LSKVKIALVILLVWSIAATGFAAFYYTQYASLRELYTEAFIKADICLNYGNGTKVWHNETLIAAGSSVLDLTMKVARVDTTTRPGHKGVGVAAINDVAQVEDPEQGLYVYWFWFLFDPEAEQWVLGPAMPSEYELKPGDVICWYYEPYTTWPPPPPS
jgi:hypothetical protein